jgi:7-keto-8-aminopelargonate synthetase-like enzyme
VGVLDDFDAELARLKEAGLARSLKEVSSRQGAEITLDGRAVLNACSNDYLGLAAHPRVIDAAKDAAEKYGAGAGAARLIVGNFSARAAGTRTSARSRCWRARATSSSATSSTTPR